MKKLALFLSITALVAGCATRPPIAPELMAKAKDPLYCQGEKQCADMWERAQVWVVKHSRYRIQNITGSLIETFTPERNSEFPGYRLLKEPEGGGKYRIWISPIWNTYFPSGEKTIMDAIDFKEYLKKAG